MSSEAFLGMITRLLSASSYLCSNTTTKVWFPVILSYTQVQTYSVFIFVDIISVVVGNGLKPYWTNYIIPSSQVTNLVDILSCPHQLSCFWYVRTTEVTRIQLICEFDSWTWNSVWSIYLIHLCKYTFLIISYSWPVCFQNSFNENLLHKHNFNCISLIFKPL